MGSHFVPPYKSHGATNTNGKHFIARESFEWRRTNKQCNLWKFNIRSNCEFLSGLHHLNGFFLGLCLPKVAFPEGKASFHQEHIVDLIWTELQTHDCLLTISGCFCVGLTLLTFPPKGAPVSRTSWAHPLIFPSFFTLCLDPSACSRVIHSHSFLHLLGIRSCFHCVSLCYWGRHKLFPMVSSFSPPQDSWRPNCTISLTTLESLFYQAHRTEMTIVRFQN